MRAYTDRRGISHGAWILSGKWASNGCGIKAHRARQLAKEKTQDALRDLFVYRNNMPVLPRGTIIKEPHHIP
jgi:hypothetical protein